MPALPEGHYAPVGPGLDGPLRMHFHDVGPSDPDRTPVLFLHGSGPGASGWSNFADNAAFLAEHGFRSLLPDSMGYGYSSKPTDRLYTLDFMAGAALAMLDHLGVQRVTVVGNSQGGAQAIWLALHHPQRVERLVLMAPGGLEQREVYMQMKGIRSMMRCIYGEEGITLEGMKKVFSKQIYDISKFPEEVVERRYEVAMTQPRHVFESMRVANQAEELDQLTQPTLGLWGVNDLFCPVSGAKTLVERVPDCRVVTLNRCGHWVMVERPALFNRLVLDFLLHG